MIGSLLKLSALEEFHATLAERFDGTIRKESVESLKYLNDYCQRLQRTALAAEAQETKTQIWMRVHNAIVFVAGIEDDVNYYLKSLGIITSSLYELPNVDNPEKEFSLIFFNRLNDLVSKL